MIVLTEVANKLQELLNANEEFNQYEFVVATQGFHLDYVFDKDTGKNFIPVFISSMGGQYNPVENLNEATYTIPVTFYFPVRFKDDFYRLNEYLANCFVGKKINYGLVSGFAISNISVSQYGEIQQLDLKEFKEWVGSIYKLPIEVLEMWMSMTFTLYLSTASEDYVWGNDATISLSTTIDNETYTDDNVTFAESSLQSQSQPTSQQALGETEVEGIPFGTSYSNSFSVYIKDNNFYNKVIEKWFNGDIQTIRFSLTLTLLDKQYERTCYIESVNMPIRKGQLVTITFTLAKALA